MKTRGTSTLSTFFVIPISFFVIPVSFYVIPVNTRIQQYVQLWVPACAGMRREGARANKRGARKWEEGAREWQYDSYVIPVNTGSHQHQHDLDTHDPILAGAILWGVARVVQGACFTRGRPVSGGRVLCKNKKPSVRKTKIMKTVLVIWSYKQIHWGIKKCEYWIYGQVVFLLFRNECG